MYFEIKDGPARIGTSKFFFDVWYKITNEKALVPCGYCGNGWNADSNEPPKTYFVGDYSREQFKSVLFQLYISKSALWKDKYDVEVLCFADTRKYGAETIVYMKTDDPNKIDSCLFEYAAEVLSRSGAVLDHELNQKDLDSRKEKIATMQAYNDKLARIMQIDKIGSHLPKAKKEPVTEEQFLSVFAHYYPNAHVYNVVDDGNADDIWARTLGNTETERVLYSRSAKEIRTWRNHGLFDYHFSSIKEFEDWLAKAHARGMEFECESDL